MIKLFAIMALSLSTLLGGKQHEISSIEIRGSWIYLYDASGSQYRSLPAGGAGDILGYSSSFFVTQKGSWIYLYDAEGKRYKSMPAGGVGDVIGVAGDTFTSRKGSWIYTWDRNGKKLSSRPGR